MPHLNSRLQLPVRMLVWIITVAFLLRVLIQLQQSLSPVSWLPSFQQWHSGSMPYGLLLSIQIAILCVMVICNRRLTNNQWRLRKKTRDILRRLGWCYLLFMLLRLMLGLSIYSHLRFFNNYLTTAFHLLLAAYVMVLVYPGGKSNVAG